MSLRYPMGGVVGQDDYVEFTPRKYRANSRGGPLDTGLESIILYMPNSTPTVGNDNNWGQVNFPGPLGNLQKRLGASLVGSIQDAGAGTNIDSIVNTFKTEFEGQFNTKNVTAAGKQLVTQLLPQEIMGATGTQILAMSRGQIYNPNVELIYNNPQLRGFSFTFELIPKSATEQSQINRIIRVFKSLSAPRDLENGMFEVPYVWQVRYMTNGVENIHMNRFKKAACVSVATQNNSQTEMHVSHPDGAPVSTTLQVTFREVDIITRKDHLETTGQGY